MTIETAIWLNVVGVLAVATLIGLLGGEDNTERAGIAFGFGWFLFCLSLTGWIIYVAVHFISKYW